MPNTLINSEGVLPLRRNRLSRITALAPSRLTDPERSGSGKIKPLTSLNRLRVNALPTFNARVSGADTAADLIEAF